MKKILELTNRYIIVATPLLLFLFFISVYFMVIFRNGQFLHVLFGIVLFCLMSVAFAAGWANMIKSAVDEKNYDEPYLIIKDFAPGVGEYFLPVLGLSCISFLINVIIFVLIYYAGMHFIGDIGVSVDTLSRAMSGPEALKVFLTSLSAEQFSKLSSWNILLLTTISAIYFLMMFYFPALFYETKNPFKAFFKSLRNLLGKKLLSNFGIYLLIFGINSLISIFSALVSNNTILSFILTLINFYFICCVVIGIFYYYNKNFVNKHLGNTIDTYI